MRKKHISLEIGLDDICSELRGMVIRAESQLKFAAKLAELPEHAGRGFKELVAEAAEIAGCLKRGVGATALETAVAAVEEKLLPMNAAAKEFTAHCVGHAHIDMNWMWSYPETVSAVNDTFITVMKLMEEFPEFRFSQSQVSVYDIILKYNPELFDRIKTKVAEGRWEVTASQWVEGDKNLPSGESFLRHLEMSRAFLCEHFGFERDDIKLAWEPDTFGHANTIPSLFSSAGVKYYYFCRGGEKQLPPLFHWEGPDGSRLLANHEITWYNDCLGPHNTDSLLAFHKKTGLKDWMLVFGVGDHGGGPTRRDLRILDEMKTWPVFPRFVNSRAVDYFELIDENHSDNLPVVKGELNFEFTGCYVSQSKIKRANREAENMLEDAEFAGVLEKAVIGKSTPAPSLENAWINTLFGHFHDILPGSGVADTTHYHLGKFQESAADAGIAKTSALRAVASEIDTSFFADAGSDIPPSPWSETEAMGGGAGQNAENASVSSASHSDSSRRVFTVFNPSPFERREVVEAILWDVERDGEELAFSALQSDGSTVAAERLRGWCMWQHIGTAVAVSVVVPPCGYASFAVESKLPPTPHPWGVNFGYERESEPSSFNDGCVANLAVRREMANAWIGEYGMENEFLKVVFDKTTGCVSSLIDKKSGFDVFKGSLEPPALEYVLEHPGEMSAWRVHPPLKIERLTAPAKFAPKSNNPLIVSYVAEYAVGKSTVMVTYSLKAAAAALEVSIDADWREIGSEGSGIPSLRLSLPTGLKSMALVRETPYGSVESAFPENELTPTRNWVFLKGKDADGSERGFLVLNDSAGACALNASGITVPMLRSTYEPDPVPEVGKRHFSFALTPWSGSADLAECKRCGDSFNHKLIVVATDAHEGGLPDSAGLFRMFYDGKVVATGPFKGIEQATFVVRLLETSGKNGVVRLEFDKRLVSVTAVWRMPDPAVAAVESAEPIAIADSSLTLNLSPNELTSIAVEIKSKCHDNEPY